MQRNVHQYRLRRDDPLDRACIRAIDPRADAGWIAWIARELRERPREFDIAVPWWLPIDLQHLAACITHALREHFEADVDDRQLALLQQCRAHAHISLRLPLNARVRSAGNPALPVQPMMKP